MHLRGVAGSSAALNNKHRRLWRKRTEPALFVYPFFQTGGIIKVGGFWVGPLVVRRRDDSLITYRTNAHGYMQR